MKQSLVILAASFAGFLGGLAGARFVGTAAPSPVAQVVRARNFELLDESGAVISYWGIDEGQDVVLAFGGHWADRPGGRRRLPGNPHLGLRDPQNQLASIGVVDDFPLLQFRGEDGKPRARLLISMFGKPSLLMDDERGVRVALGIEQSDTPGPEDNDWSLLFKPDMAWIGMRSFTEKGHTYLRGGVAANKQKIKYP